MNALRNKVQLIGRLGTPVEVKKLDNGNALGKCALATNEVYKNKNGERVEETTWHNLVIWGKSAEILAKYTDKGSEVAIEGKISNNNYTDKEGVKRYSTEIVVNDFLLMGSKKANEESDLPF